MQVGLLDYVTLHYKPTEEMQTSSLRSGISAKFKYLFCRCPCFASRNNPHNEDINSDVDDNVSYVSNDDSVDNEDLTIFLENGERPEGMTEDEEREAAIRAVAAFLNENERHLILRRSVSF